VYVPIFRTRTARNAFRSGNVSSGRLFCTDIKATGARSHPTARYCPLRTKVNERRRRQIGTGPAIAPRNLTSAIQKEQKKRYRPFGWYTNTAVRFKTSVVFAVGQCTAKTVRNRSARTTIKTCEQTPFNRNAYCPPGLSRVLGGTGVLSTNPTDLVHTVRKFRRPEPRVCIAGATYTAPYHPAGRKISENDEKKTQTGTKIRRTERIGGAARDNTGGTVHGCR